MKRISNQKSIKLSDLERSGLYTEKLIEKLKNGNFEEIGNLSSYQKADIDFIGPIFWAVKNEFDTYKVYQYLGENLQNDAVLASEIIIKEPELIKATPISRNKQFILDNASKNPKIINYMSSELKEDNIFISELNKMYNPEISKKINDILLNNMDTIANQDFLKIAISENVELLEKVSDELKDNYSFIKKVCSGNKGATDYIVEHTDNFGIKGITAVKDVIVEESSTKAIKGFENELIEIDNKVQPTENETEKKDVIRKKQLDRHIKLINKIKSGEVNQERALRLIKNICKNLDEDYRIELEKYIKLDDAVIEKKQEDKKMTESNKESSLENYSDNSKKISIAEVRDSYKDIEISDLNKSIRDFKNDVNPNKNEKDYNSVEHNRL